jgi:CubicO group peptidase (beta-lactamase class C family)
VALLEAEGRLSLDDEVGKYIPELPDFGHPITIRHLVHHTSGIRDWPATLGIAGWDYQDVISFQQILRMAFGQQELNFVPGAEHAYSNTGYNLLAEIVARVSGVSYREFCQARIFGPLEMTHTHVHDDHTEVVPDRAHSYRPAPGGEYHLVWNSLTALGSSSIFTTIEDLAKWVGNFENPMVGGPAVIRRMQYAAPSARAQRASFWLAAATDLADLELALTLVAAGGAAAVAFAVAYLIGRHHAVRTLAAAHVRW